MSQQQQINLKEKSLVELKAIAYDLSVVQAQYSQMIQLVNQEINARAEAEKAAAESGTIEAPVKKLTKK